MDGQARAAQMMTAANVEENRKLHRKMEDKKETRLENYSDVGRTLQKKIETLNTFLGNYL